MKNKTVKKLMGTLLIGALCAGMTMAVYAAPSGERPAVQDGQQMGQPPRDGQMKGQPPQDGQMKGQPPQGELPDGAEEGERPELPEGVEEGERPELPEGVSDNGTQRSGRQPEMKGERPEREKPEGDLPEGAVNIGAYKAALEAVDDEDLKSSLQEYIDRLEDALDAEKTALDSEDELTDAEMAEYRQAVDDASEALSAAFEEAGIEVDESDKPEEDELPAGAAGNKTIDKAQKEKTGEASGAGNDTKTTPQADTSSDAKTKGSSEGKKNALTGKLSELYNWLKGIFG
ncbi:MAG TPA: hypothetical protein DCZ52_00555 [Lachnospiraceae bacterium]|nr:hypothetical protein [Lachnospiraceae bacterium]